MAWSPLQFIQFNTQLRYIRLELSGAAKQIEKTRRSEKQHHLHLYSPSRSQVWSSDRHSSSFGVISAKLPRKWSTTTTTQTATACAGTSCITMAHAQTANAIATLISPHISPLPILYQQTQELGPPSLMTAIKLRCVLFGWLEDSAVLENGADSHTLVQAEVLETRREESDSVEREGRSEEQRTRL